MIIDIIVGGLGFLLFVAVAAFAIPTIVFDYLIRCDGDNDDDRTNTEG